MIKNSSNLKKLLQKFKESGFELIQSKDKSYFYIKNEKEEAKILEIKDSEYILHLLKIEENNSIIYQKGFKYLISEKDFDLLSILYFKEKKYQLSAGWQFRRINNLGEDIEKLIIKQKYKQKRINKKGKSLTISPNIYSLILKDIWRAEDKSRKYKSSVRNYLLNDLTGEYS